MLTKVMLVDINAEVVDAWREVFADNPEIEILCGSMLDQDVDAWVTPTNAKGDMNGGLDYVIREHLGKQIEDRVQDEIRMQYQGHMPVGCATVVESGGQVPRFLVSTPTMQKASEDISQTKNVAYACAAAFQAIHMKNRLAPGSIQSFAIPGLGAQTGQVPVDVCARLMWSGYHLFRRHRFRNFQEMRKTLDAKFDDRDPKSSKEPIKYIEGPLLPDLKVGSKRDLSNP